MASQTRIFQEGVNRVEDTDCTDWVNPGNITAEDTNYATGSLENLDQSTDLLYGSDARFAIPPDAQIDGIRIRVKRKATVEGFLDIQAHLVKSGVVVGANQAISDIYPLTEAWYAYGGATDKWGETWTSADINASDFGFVNRAQNGAGGDMTGSVNVIEATVYYTPTEPAMSPKPQVQLDVRPKALPDDIRPVVGRI